MKLTFYGAARKVTGSKHLIEEDGKRILLDCGMHQGPNSREENLSFPFDPKSIDIIVLSHAHIDHSGLIPYIVKQGFTGKIYTTYATLDLVRIMLLDSAEIQEHDADFFNERRKRHNINTPEAVPLYTTEDVETAMKQFEGYQYESSFMITEHLEVTFKDAGHILGSATVTLRNTVTEKVLVFTGDLGRKGLPILKDPTLIDHADYLITESTYGDREHSSVDGMEDEVAEVIKKTYDRGGKIIIPAFSIGRTQEMIYILHKLWDSKKIPELPIYIDSPLATDATEIFTKHPECYDQETFQEFLMRAHNPFHFRNLKYVRTVDESKSLNDIHTPCIIISASGMIENGRIVHHVKKALPDHKNTIMVIGYMAEGTIGRELIEGKSPIMIHGKERHVAAEVTVLNSFSAHADKHELLEFAKHIKGLQKIFLVHGEEDQQKAFQATLQREVVKEVYVPAPGDSFTL